jgi:hypothetical protein
MPRANTLAIIAAPEFSTFISSAPQTKGEKWAKLFFPSLQRTHTFAKTHARIPNEQDWLHSPRWLGLRNQPIADFEETGIAIYIRDLVISTEATLPHHYTRLAQPRAAITGGFWDTPSVLANIPLAARTRIRAKLAPKQIRLAFFMSSGLNAERMSALTAKITHSIWEYIESGGAVDLQVAYVGRVKRAHLGCKGLIIETRVNTSDVASLALSLSPVMYRAICGPLQTAFSDSPQDAIPSPAHCPLPNYLWIGGSMEAAIKAAETTIKALAITHT